MTRAHPSANHATATTQAATPGSESMSVATTSGQRRGDHGGDEEHRLLEEHPTPAPQGTSHHRRTRRGGERDLLLAPREHVVAQHGEEARAVRVVATHSTERMRTAASPRPGETSRPPVNRAAPAAAISSSRTVVDRSSQYRAPSEIEATAMMTPPR